MMALTNAIALPAPVRGREPMPRAIPFQAVHLHSGTIPFSRRNYSTSSAICSS